MHLIDRRVGKERVAESLEGVAKSEFYIRAAQRPQPVVKHAAELLLDYQFTKIFKCLEGDLLKLFRPNGDVVQTNSDVVIASYKKLIKQQDETIAGLIQEVKTLKEKVEEKPKKECVQNGGVSLWVLQPKTSLEQSSLC